ncbi:hypothetical protein B0H14DRAFT_2899873, partial [Mycena olivaceomarginata]
QGPTRRRRGRTAECVTIVLLVTSSAFFPTLMSDPVLDHMRIEPNKTIRIDVRVVRASSISHHILPQCQHICLRATSWIMKHTP